MLPIGGEKGNRSLRVPIKRWGKRGEINARSERFKLIGCGLKFAAPLFNAKFFKAVSSYLQNWSDED
jgi:hypothetical protein